MDLNKHFIFTLHRNVGEGTAGAHGGGGCLETYGQDRTLRKNYGMRNDKGSFSFPSPRLLKVRHIFYAEAHVMGVLMSIAAWGEGVVSLCPPSPSSDRSSLAQKCAQQHWLGPRAPPPSLRRGVCSPRPQMNTSVIKSQKDLDDLMGEPPEFLPTHVCDVYSPIGKNWHPKS
jgi:hypothetical protein